HNSGNRNRKERTQGRRDSPQKMKNEYAEKAGKKIRKRKSGIKIKKSITLMTMPLSLSQWALLSYPPDSELDLQRLPGQA
ncbi:hypothetical protein, partial [Methanosarcina sp. KYL-1]|uniref:hypothetical protein n=1 Tax=Methanosarcina sp. KYL-1 TaxID=2602068 RepID=UPI00210176D3